MNNPLFINMGVFLVLVGIYDFWRETPPYLETGVDEFGVNKKQPPKRSTKNNGESAGWRQGHGKSLASCARISLAREAQAWEDECEKRQIRKSAVAVR